MDLALAQVPVVPNHKAAEHHICHQMKWIIYPQDLDVDWFQRPYCPTLPLADEAIHGKYMCAERYHEDHHHHHHHHSCHHHHHHYHLFTPSLCQTSEFKRCYFVQGISPFFLLLYNTIPAFLTAYFKLLHKHL